MKAKHVLIVGCGALVLMALAGVIGIVLFISYASQDLEGVALAVNGPRDVTVGQTFDLEIVVKNDRPTKPVQLSDVDIAEKYLAGFTVSSVKPPSKSDMHVPLDNSRSYTFDASIPPGTSQSFVFTLRAERIGIYRGDVDVCEGVRFVSGLAQTVVQGKK